MCIILLGISIWALNNKAHGRPIFQPLFVTNEKAPNVTVQADVQLDNVKTDKV